MADRQSITRSFVSSALVYDPSTGSFTWKQRADQSKSWNTRYAGKLAGYVWSPPNNPSLQYRIIKLNGIAFKTAEQAQAAYAAKAQELFGEFARTD